MSSLAAARADNFYFPQEWRPEHGSINQFHKSHPLGKRVKADGVLVVRFEMPFNVWCTHCETHIGRGVRFNARKKAVDKYFSTVIYEFRLTCTHCQGEMVVRTDPEHRGYNLVSGIRQKVEGRAQDDGQEIDTERVNDPQVAIQIREDAFFRIEHEQQDERIARERARGLDALMERQEKQFQDDYASNSALRATFRQQKKQIKQRLDQGSRLGLAIPLVDVHPDDVIAAKATVFQQIPRHLKSRLEDTKSSVRASASRPSSAKRSTGDSSFQHFGDPTSSHLHRLKRAKQLKKVAASQKRPVVRSSGTSLAVRASKLARNR